MFTSVFLNPYETSHLAKLITANVEQAPAKIINICSSCYSVPVFSRKISRLDSPSPPFSPIPSPPPTLILKNVHFPLPVLNPEGNFKPRLHVACSVPNDRSFQKRWTEMSLAQKISPVTPQNCEEKGKH